VAGFDNYDNPSSNPTKIKNNSLYLKNLNIDLPASAVIESLEYKALMQGTNATGAYAKIALLDGDGIMQ
jgi:hypothetical protein